jgi:hypothetical protein
VVRYDRHGVKYPDSLFESACWFYQVCVLCRPCGHRAVFDPYQLWYRFHRRGWEDHIRHVRTRLKCSKCSAKDVVVQFEKNRQPTVVLPMPPEREWQRMVKRFRS